MNQIKEQFIHSILQLDSEAYPLNRWIIDFALIQASFLNISYIHKNWGYLRVIQGLARPQLIFNFQDVEYYTIVLSLWYILSLAYWIPGRRIIALFAQFLDVCLLNFLFEISSGIPGIIAQMLLIIIATLRLVCIYGKLDVDVVNFEIIQNSKYSILLKLVNLIQMIIYVTDVNQHIQSGIAIFSCLCYIKVELIQKQRNMVIIMGIQLITIWHAIISFFGEIDLFWDIILIPFVFRIIYTYVDQMKYQSSHTLNSIIYRINNQCKFQQHSVINCFHQFNNRFLKQKVTLQSAVIYTSLLLKLHMNYEAFMRLSQLLSFGSFNKQKLCITIPVEIRIKFLMKKCAKRLVNQISANSFKSSGISEQIQELLRSDELNHQIQSSIIRIFKQKIEVYQDIIQNTLRFWRIYEVSKDIIRVQKLLVEQFQTYPNEKNQAVLGFYFIEVINDILAANEIFSPSTFLEDTNYMSNTKLFSNEVVNIVFDYEDTLIVRKASKNIFQVFQISQIDMVNKPVDFLIPQGVREHHSELIEHLFKSGQSKYIWKMDLNYYLRPMDQLLISVDFSVDIYFNNDKLNFVAFLQPTQNQPMAIILNQQYQITAMSYSLSQALHHKVSQNKLLGRKIHQLVPEFQEGSNILVNIEVSFGSNANTSTQGSRQQFQSYTSTYYTTTIYVNSKNLDKINGEGVYHILVFEYLKRINQSTQISTSVIPQNDFENQQDEDVQIIQPYEDKHPAFFSPNIGNNQHDDQAYQIRQQAILSPQASFTADPLINSKRPLYFSGRNHQLSIDDIPDSKPVDVIVQQDIGSYASTVQGIRKSKYYKKYTLIQKLTQLSSESRNLQMFNRILISGLLLQCILQIIQLLTLDTNLTQLVSDIDLLQIKLLVFQPLESFLVTRWTILNYNAMLDAKQISKEEHTQLIKFPVSNLALGYDDLAVNVASVLNKQELQQLLENTQIPILVYIDTNIGEQYQVSLRTAITILLSYQYTFKMAYQLDGRAVADTPYAYYSYLNYHVLKSQFSSLNEDVLTNTIDRAISMKSTILVLFIVIIITITIFVFYSTLFYMKLSNSYRKQLMSLVKLDQYHVQMGISHSQEMIEQIQADSNTIFKFTFDLKYFENSISNQLNQNRDRQVTYCSGNSVGNPKSILPLLILYFLIISISIATYMQAAVYLDDYPDTARLYKQMSDVGTDVPTMYAQREILYGRNVLPFLNQNNLDNILEEIVQALKRIKVFNQQTSLLSDQLLLSTSFTQFYDGVMNSNVCSLLDQDMAVKAIDICPIVMNQLMTKGLKLILTYVENQIQIDMDTTKFISRNGTISLELEGAFLIGEVIRAINQEFKNDLQALTQMLLSQINGYNISLLIIIMLVSLFVATVLRSRLIAEYYIVQRINYIAPRLSILSDSYYERSVRQIILENTGS